jgi:cell division protein FtsB
MRLLALILAACIVLLQWPLWIGKGSWLKVWQIESQLSEQQLQNQKLSTRNAALEAEVRDLKTGTDAIEERARNELGMVRQDEVFFQILDPKPATIAPPAAKPPVAAPVPAPASTSAPAPAAAPPSGSPATAAAAVAASPTPAPSAPVTAISNP